MCQGSFVALSQPSPGSELYNISTCKTPLTHTRYILHNLKPELMTFDAVPFRKMGKRALSAAVSALTVCSMVQPESRP